MLQVLRRRAAEAGVAERIETHISTDDAIGLRGRDSSFDFALAFTMLHEVGNQANFLREIYHLLKPGAPLLLTEPIKHVTRAEFDRTVSLAQHEGLAVTGHPLIRLSHSVVLTKST
jgi:ubiquinone/menaquinone biosynthesis C-methylase UbiE